MVFPGSPFTNKFNIATIFQLHKNADSAGEIEINQNPFLWKLLEWLCTTPEVTSYRVNTLKYSLTEVKSFLEMAFHEGVKYQDYYYISPHPSLRDVLLIKPLLSDSFELSRYEKEIIVDPACGAAVLRGSHIFAPGVLAMKKGTQIGEIVSVYVDIARKCKKGLAKTFDCPNKYFIGNGEILMDRYTLFGENLKPSGIAVQMIETTSRVPALDSSVLSEDAALLQNIPSITCGHVLNPSPGEIVLDMCASPGNKTTHLATLMKDQGTLIALDKTPNKVLKLKQTCEKFSLTCVHSFIFDSTKSYDEKLDKNHTYDLSVGPPFSKECFDKILLDAPCSNLGRRPQLYNNISDKEARSFVPLQRKLFTNAVHLLKINGHLVYSTCTITLSENEGMVAWALDTFSCLDLVPAPPNLGGSGWAGTKLMEEQRKLVQRFGPEQIDDTVGFFIAHFIKKCGV